MTYWTYTTTKGIKMGMDNDIAAVLLGDMDPELAINRAALTAAVQRKIFCPETGIILDVRTAVLFEVAHKGDGVGMAVINGEYWDTIADKIRTRCAQQEIKLTVHDGRELFAKGNGK